MSRRSSDYCPAGTDPAEFARVVGLFRFRTRLAKFLREEAFSHADSEGWLSSWSTPGRTIDIGRKFAPGRSMHAGAAPFTLTHALTHRKSLGLELTQLADGPWKPQNAVALKSPLLLASAWVDVSTERRLPGLVSDRLGLFDRPGIAFQVRHPTDRRVECSMASALVDSLLSLRETVLANNARVEYFTVPSFRLEWTDGGAQCWWVSLLWGERDLIGKLKVRSARLDDHLPLVSPYFNGKVPAHAARSDRPADPGSAS